ncbi:hypothetical protein FJ365_02245 [Candidatus Dependentiae bacterium]|nr:hypothetical protein [Candidatus Dependentiae bacterium]
MKIMSYKLFGAVMTLLCAAYNVHAQTPGEAMAATKEAMGSEPVSAARKAPQTYAVAAKNNFIPYRASKGKWNVGSMWSCDWDWFGEWKTDIPGYFLFEYMPNNPKIDSSKGNELTDNGKYEVYWPPAPLPADAMPHGIGFSSTLPDVGTVSTAGPNLPLVLVLNSVGISAGGGYNGGGTPGRGRGDAALTSRALPPFGTIQANAPAANTFPGLGARYFDGGQPPQAMPSNCFKMANPRANSMYLVELNQIENTLRVWTKPEGAPRDAYTPVITDPVAQAMIFASMEACKTPAQYFTFVADTIMMYAIWKNGSASQAWPIQYSVSQVQSLVSGKTVASKAPSLLVCPAGSFFLHRVGGTSGSSLRAPSWFDDWATTVPGDFEFSFDTDLKHDIMVGFSPTKLSGAAAGVVPLVLKIGINNNQHGCVLFNMSPCDSAEEAGGSTEFPARIPTDLYAQSGSLNEAITIKIVFKQTAENVNGTKGTLSAWAKSPGSPDASYIQIFDGDSEATIADMIAEAPANLKYFSLTKGNDEALGVKTAFFRNVVVKVPTDSPATDSPAADKPATDKPATDKPAADKPSVENPAAKAAGQKIEPGRRGFLRKKKRNKAKNKKPSVDTSAANASQTEKPDEKEPSDQKTADEKPVGKTTSSSVRKTSKKAAAKKAAAKKAAARKAAARKAAAKK